MKFTYKTTIFACFTGAAVQAVIVNFAPLLFITFQNAYNIPLAQITWLVAANFAVQLTVDFLATFFVDKIGYRISIVTAQFLSGLGLLLLAVLPEIMPPFAGVLTATVIYTVGGGLIEVLVSPIMESCPTDNKEKAMSLLHSFYSWGQVGVVLISTVFFVIFDIRNWKILAAFWALVPLANGLLFLKTPIAPLIAKGEKKMGIKALFKSRVFPMFIVMMMCAGAAEQAVAQWASAFAEQGLGVTKTVGDLAGPMAFAVLMGTARLIYGKFGDRINLDRFMTGSVLLCIAAYLLAALSPWPVLNLAGCAITGFAVGILWPGTLSKAAVALPMGGTAVFALLALAGDIGCTVGPGVVGFVSDTLGGNMQMGILAALVFPVVLLLCLLGRKK